MISDFNKRFFLLLLSFSLLFMGYNIFHGNYFLFAFLGLGVFLSQMLLLPYFVKILTLNNNISTKTKIGFLFFLWCTYYYSINGSLALVYLIGIISLYVFLINSELKEYVISAEQSPIKYFSKNIKFLYLLIVSIFIVLYLFKMNL